MSKRPDPAGQTAEQQQAERAAGYWLLAAAVVVMLPHTLRLPWWLSTILTLLFAWRYFMLRRAWPTPPRWLRWLLTVVIVFLLWRHYGTLIGRDAGSSLLAAMLALKLTELQRRRDYIIGAMLIYFLILIGLLYSQTLWLLAYLLAVFVLTTAMLVRLTVPGARPRYALRLALVLLLQALPLMLAMHLFFPRMQGALWGLPLDRGAGITGLSDTMRPGMINELSLSEEVAFRAHFQGVNPTPAELYWRTIVLWHTNGRVWTRGVVADATTSYQAEHTPLAYTLTLEPSGQTWLPALDLPATVPLGAQLTAGFALVLSQPVRERVTLEMHAQQRYRITQLSRAEQRAALRLDESPGPRTAALVQTLRGQNASDEQLVQNLLQHFNREQFVYTLEPPELGDNPVDEFLFDTRRGFCEHYASAFVTVMRVAGIPARVVTGYQGGEYNPAGNYFIVRQSDAHAWAEAWLPDKGWVRIDPTAAVAPERIEYGASGLVRLLSRGATLGNVPAELLRDLLATGAFDRLRGQLRLTWDAVNTGWQRWVLGYGMERQRGLLEQLGLAGISPARLLGMLALLVAAVMGIYALASREKQKSDPIVSAYRLYCSRIMRLGLVRADNEGPLAFAERCARQRPDLAESIHNLTAAYLRLRYGVDRQGNGLRDFRRRVRGFRPAPA